MEEINFLMILLPATNSRPLYNLLRWNIWNRHGPVRIPTVLGPVTFVVWILRVVITAGFLNRFFYYYCFTGLVLLMRKTAPANTFPFLLPVWLLILLARTMDRKILEPGTQSSLFLFLLFCSAALLPFCCFSGCITFRIFSKAFHLIFSQEPSQSADELRGTAVCCPGYEDNPITESVSMGQTGRFSWLAPWVLLLLHCLLRGWFHWFRKRSTGVPGIAQNISTG